MSVSLSLPKKFESKKFPANPSEGQVSFIGPRKFMFKDGVWEQLHRCSCCKDMLYLRWYSKDGFNYDRYPPPVVKCFCTQGERKSGASVLQVVAKDPGADIRLFHDDAPADLGNFGRQLIETRLKGEEE